MPRWQTDSGVDRGVRKAKQFLILPVLVKAAVDDLENRGVMMLERSNNAREFLPGPVAGRRMKHFDRHCKPAGARTLRLRVTKDQLICGKGLSPWGPRPMACIVRLLFGPVGCDTEPDPPASLSRLIERTATAQAKAGSPCGRRLCALAAAEKIDERGLKTGHAEQQRHSRARGRSNSSSRASAAAPMSSAEPGQFRSDDPEIACHEGCRTGGRWPREPPRGGSPRVR